MNRNTLTFSVLSLALLAAPATFAQDANFKELIEQGRYNELADKLEAHVKLDKYDDELKTYVQMNIDYLRRGGKPKTPGSEIILVRGAKNDKLYQMPKANGRKQKDDYEALFDEAEMYPSGGPRLMLPNRIRYARRSWDDRLPLIDKYFVEGTDLVGGDGESLRELEKIITHHKGGGLGTSANSTKSVLISASTKPLWAFGPPYYIIKIAPERCIFNYKGLSGEFEVLIPFWILPHEIVFRGDTREEIENHPAYKDNNPFKDLPFHDYSSGYPHTNNWELIENNIRNGRPALPLNPDGIRNLAGEVVVEGSKVFVESGGKTFRLKGDQAKTLKKFKGLEVRLKGKEEGEEFEIREIDSPVEATMTAEVNKNWNDEINLVTNNHDYVEVSGTPARALKNAVDSRVTVEGWRFTNNYGDTTHFYITGLMALANGDVDLRNGPDVPSGDMVKISYVSRSGKSAIIKHSNGWGWAKLTELDLETGNTSGAAGILSSIGN